MEMMLFFQMKRSTWSSSSSTGSGSAQSGIINRALAGEIRIVLANQGPGKGAAYQ